ncbi:MAG: FAD/NAD(P)-binding protein, partial [Pseudomonadota bacterium]|nr:FAD/NAD(P)-binding protein [Pseudomonadota bacterium]
MSGSICIIGSGFSAASLALHLVSDGLPGDCLTIVGPGRLGSGQAYGCVADDFRLNVRADLQRIGPDDPNHFVRWAAARLENDHDAVTDVGTFYR